MAVLEQLAEQLGVARMFFTANFRRHEIPESGIGIPESGI